MFYSVLRSHPVFRLLLYSAVAALMPLPIQAEQTVTPTETLIRLTVSPMPAPKPALRYSLLPELKELNPGNPIANYMKCWMSQDFYAQATFERISAAGLRQADLAARMDKPDWQILSKLKSDGIGLLIPDVQKIRAVAAGLKERFHREVADNRLDDALVTAKTLFAMARHTAEHPTLIGELVGIAITFIAIGQFEEMLERPACPNFYWALTNLPSPFISLDKGFEGERILFCSEFKDLSDTTPMTADQIKKVIIHIDRLQMDVGKTEAQIRTLLDARAKDAVYMTAVRKRLMDYGIAEQNLQRFSTDQMILLDERRETETRRDEELKLLKLPIWQAEELLAKIKKHKDFGVFDILLPFGQRVFRTQGRLDQRLALLRHVEALRIYVAEHDGKLPQKLSDFTVPLPNDPVTGKPFHYSVDGDTVHLRGTPAPTTEKLPAHNIHYEVKFRGK